VRPTSQYLQCSNISIAITSRVILRLIMIISYLILVFFFTYLNWYKSFFSENLYDDLFVVGVAGMNIYDGLCRLG